MPDLNNRADMETEIARKLGKVNREVLNDILDMLGDPPDISKLTEDKWLNIQKTYEAVVIGALENVFMEAAQQAADAAGIGVDWALVNTRAANWATQYGFDLVKDMTANRRAFLQKSVDDFYRTGMTIGDLKQRLSRDYGPVRAQSIAVSETTRASVEGQRAYINTLQQQGVRFKKRITTAYDERVCAICGPKQGKDPDVEGYAPYHPGCRCGFEVEPIIEGVSG